MRGKANKSVYRTLYAALALLLTSLSVDAYAMRCGTRLVTEGMHLAEVLAICGEPVAESRRTVLVTQVLPVTIGGSRRYRLNERGQYVSRGIGPVTSEVEVIEFTYNFGPRRFMRLVEFRNARVAFIRDLGYGYNPR
ncbi:MAG: DUF2845 domain-containing protein [Pseudomonadota bacterium]